MSFIIVDVGCIECSEQTTICAIVDTKEEAQKRFLELCKELGIKKWEACRGILEILTNSSGTTYIGGTGYFTSGQRALEVHQYPKEAPK